MYLPPAFSAQDLKSWYNLIDNYALATVIALPEAEISNIPLLLAHENGKSYLRGHIARANPLHQLLKCNPDLLCIFNGPHGYISPSYYHSEALNVPTWNYAVVHVKGQARLVDTTQLISILDASIDKHEAKLKQPWSIDWNNELAHKKLNGIIGFELEISHIQGKFKLSQNRTIEEKNNVMRELAGSTNPDDQILASFMDQE